MTNWGRTFVKADVLPELPYCTYITLAIKSHPIGKTISLKKLNFVETAPIITGAIYNTALHKNLNINEYLLEIS